MVTESRSWDAPTDQVDAQVSANATAVDELRRFGSAGYSLPMNASLEMLVGMVPFRELFRSTLGSSNSLRPSEG